MREISVFGGSAHPELASQICAMLGVPQQPVVTRRFANDCLEVQLQSNCRERDVFLIQPLSPPVQDHLVELLLMLDAARGASAARVTAVIPHYAYARSDKKNMPRVSIGGRLVADLLVAAGASRVLTMTLHSPQVHGFFSVPVDHLHALSELACDFRGLDLSGTTVVSPDLGNAKHTACWPLLGVPIALGAKERQNDERVTISSIIGEVAGRTSSSWTTRSPAEPRSSSCSTGWPSAAPGPCGWPARTACSATARWSGSRPGPRSPRSSAPTPCRCPATARSPS